MQNAKNYRVQIHSRVPEGRTWVVLDTKTRDSRFIPPQSLTNFKAVVEVMISAECPDAGSDVSPSAHRFYIDTAALCPAADDIRVGRVARSLLAEWTPVTPASHYEVSLYSALSGALLSHHVSHTSSISLQEVAEPLLVMAVRPYCPAGFGETVYKLLDADLPGQP